MWLYMYHVLDARNLAPQMKQAEIMERKHDKVELSCTLFLPRVSRCLPSLLRVLHSSCSAVPRHGFIMGLENMQRGSTTNRGGSSNCIA